MAALGVLDPLDDAFESELPDGRVVKAILVGRWVITGCCVA